MTLTSTAVRLQPAFADPATVRRSIEAAGPYWPIVRYAVSAKERAALGSSDQPVFVPPWFRRDFALGGRPLVEGAEEILANPAFVDAARRVYGGDVLVQPTTVYVNVMGPAPFPFAPHTDVPAFRGVTRDDHPVWLLHVMHASGLFERWRVRIATAVSWFYDGPGGAFHYWPDGPEGGEQVERPPFANVAVVADNERTYHGVGPLGASDADLPRHLTVDSELFRVDGGWEVRTPGAEPVRYGDDDVRITVSWKGEVFDDDADAERHVAHTDDLDLERVVDVFVDDLHRRGTPVMRPADPHGDEAWIAALTAAYSRPGPRIA